MNYSVYDLGTNISRNNMDTETFLEILVEKPLKIIPNETVLH